MPIAPKKPCPHPGCGALVSGGGHCPRHQAAAKKPSNFSKRQSRHERGYGYQWEKLRKVVLQRDAGLCQPCRTKGTLTPANIVDHIIPKAEGGFDDMDNLQVICRRCHIEKTAKESARSGGVSYEPQWLPSPSIPVVVVCGPPGSGKTTYVGEHASSDDLVLDLDVITSELFAIDLFTGSTDQRHTALRYRNKMLASLADQQCPYPRCWLIVTAGSREKREFWRQRYGELIVMTTPKQECLSRVKADTRRSPDAVRKAVELILSWQ